MVGRIAGGRQRRYSMEWMRSKETQAKKLIDFPGCDWRDTSFKQYCFLIFTESLFATIPLTRVKFRSRNSIIIVIIIINIIIKAPLYLRTLQCFINMSYFT